MAKIITILGLLFILLQLISICGIQARTTTLFWQPKSNGTAILTGNVGICNSIIISQGYACEEHKVTTKDGYILSIQRIPQGRSTKSRNQTPLLLQHGLLMDGASWLLSSPDESLGFILADNGYDVWIANTRGTAYSRGHTSLDPSDPAYWNWSWDELVTYDLSSTVHYVHDQTQEKIHYVGHSLGTLIVLASFSENKLTDILKSAALLSPIAHLSQMSSILARAAADAFIAEDLKWLGIAEFDLGGNAVIQLFQDICTLPGTDCSDLLTALTGPNCCLNSSQAGIFIKHEPQPTATKNIIHVSQMVRQGTIAAYDYDSPDKNKQYYGQSTPPLYNMGNIPTDFPLYLGHGGGDWLSDVADVNTLLNTDLQHHNPDKLVTQYIEDYGHADFVYAVNAKKVVYEPMMAFFKLNSQ